MYKTSRPFYLIGGLLVVGGIAYLFVAHPRTGAGTPPQVNVVHVVAAENFWGSLAEQVGGAHVEVTSIVSDPNADPHEYETDAATARAVANADYVIENGAGYDEWMQKLLDAAPNPKRTVLNVASLVQKKEGDNPHLWYDPDYVKSAVKQMESDLTDIDPADAASYEANYEATLSSLAGYQDCIAAIRSALPGARVAATEDIFVYLADAAGLDLVSPPAFMQAVAEGNDPPASSVVDFENQLKSGGVRALVYNEQTVTPITEHMKAMAAEYGIPVVGITETVEPPDASFETWMDAEVASLANALGPSGK